MLYYVTLKIEETILVDSPTEAGAIKYALQCFDVTAHDPEIVEIWSPNDE